MKTVLITGSFGFIGTNLASALSDNSEMNLIAVDINNKENSWFSNFYNWDQLPEICLPLQSTILHLAGKAHDTKNDTKSDDYFEINLGLTKKIFDFFLQSAAQKFVFFSSVKAIADTVTDDILSENSVANPLTYYGQSKLAAEQYLLSKTLPEGKQVYILRPCMIHGPGNKGNLNLLYNLVQKRLPWPLGAFENLRSFTSIGNLVYIIRELIEKDIETGVYHLADDEPISTNELIALIAKSLNRNVRIWRISKSIIEILAKIGDKIYLPLNSERLKKLTDSYVVSNQKLKSVLGITNLPVRARDGLKLTFDSFNSSGKSRP